MRSYSERTCCNGPGTIVFLSQHNYVRLRFASVEEARARAALLFVRTWKSIGPSSRETA